MSGYSRLASAWTTWSPSYTSGGGAVTSPTITAVARYETVGKTVRGVLRLTLTNVGSGSPTGTVIVTTPVTPKNSDSGCAGYLLNDGTALSAEASSDGHFYINKAGGTTLWSNGNQFVISFEYEIN